MMPLIGKTIKGSMTDLHETVRVHVLVSGRVQGVGFRAFTCRQAEHYDLSGWVRNLPDGRVEAEVQGPQIDVDRFLEDMHQGPRFSNVDQVEKIWVEPDSKSTGFEVLY